MRHLAHKSRFSVSLCVRTAAAAWIFYIISLINPGLAEQLKIDTILGCWEFKTMPGRTNFISRFYLCFLDSKILVAGYYSNNEGKLETFIYRLQENYNHEVGQDKGSFLTVCAVPIEGWPISDEMLYSLRRCWLDYENNRIEGYELRCKIESFSEEKLDLSGCPLSNVWTRNQSVRAKQ